ncbi:endonuclease Q family protein [archaeon]|nr:endonuclease Q family protein [archaeon]
MIIADFHLHSRFARACSRNTTFPLLEKYARIKGVNILGTGDLQHPLWNKEIKSELKEDDNGILWTKNKFPFIWQTEISLMYSQDKRRAIHHVIFSPNGDVSDQIVEALSNKGRLDYDGRPIFGMASPELVEIMKEISDKIEIIPAHCMTPWFGLYGSKSGFDSLKECFQDKVNKIYAIETGMSADPPMLWRLKEEVNLVSFSDAHSYWPWRIGREATVFDCELTYDNIIKAIRTGEGLSSTIETVPDYGKYHYDGHRNCGVSLSPKESKKNNNLCPKCKKPLTLGVEYRIEELAKAEEYKPKNAKKFYRLIPLHELIAVFYGIKQLSSKKVWDIYNKLINSFNDEFNIMLKISYEDLCKVIDDKLAHLIIRNREDKLTVKPGYDGVYGEVVLEEKKQKNLGEF